MKSESSSGPATVADGVAPIAIENVCKTYSTRSGVIEALRGVDFTVSRGEFVALLGPSGCGKSTLLKLVAGLEAADQGSIQVAGSPARAGRRECGMMFQSPVLLPWRTVLQNVLLPAEVLKLDATATHDWAGELLETVGLTGFEEKYPWELSGGMQQRASLARLLVSKPSILLMDEPFAALDQFTRDRLTFVLTELLEGDDSRSVLYVTHNIQEAIVLADRVVVMATRPGRIVEIVDIELRRPRTPELLEADETARAATEVRHALREAGEYPA